MNRSKALAVFGTRPDAIKMAPVVKELERHPDLFDLRVVVTGQHREMLDQVLHAFNIVPDHDLNIMQQGQGLTGITTRSLEGLDKYFEAEKPEIVLAQGDTTTTFAAALSAFYHKADFAHIEAGLRTFNRFDPFPEEMNRLLTTRLATYHFPPTHASAENLLREGVNPDHVVVTGNTVIDALLTVSQAPYTTEEEPLNSILRWAHGPVVLVTAHRRENWGEPMVRICNAVRELSSSIPGIALVFAMHRNPAVRDTVRPILDQLDNVFLIEPPDYVPFVQLQKKSAVIMTDSGGVQEEAPSLGKPVLVLRETTERPEGVEAGTALLVGTDTAQIVREVTRLVNDKEAYDRMASAVSPYGDGHAAARVVSALTAFRRAPVS